MEIKTCPTCGTKYPHNECPKCKPAEFKPLTTEEHIARMSNEQIKYAWNSIWWEQGNEHARRLVLAEYDKRIGLENWPTHISREI